MPMNLNTNTYIIPLNNTLNCLTNALTTSIYWFMLFIKFVLDIIYLITIYPFKYIYNTYTQGIILLSIYITTSLGDITNLILSILLLKNGFINNTLTISLYSVGFGFSIFANIKRFYNIYKKSVGNFNTNNKPFIIFLHSLPFIIGCSFTIVSWIGINHDNEKTPVTYDKIIIFLVFSMLGILSEISILSTYFRSNDTKVAPLINDSGEQLINKIFNSYYQNDDFTCCICMDDHTYNDTDNDKNINNKNEIIIGIDNHLVKLKCSHVFHSNCIINWIKIGYKTNIINTCPMCRQEIDI